MEQQQIITWSFAIALSLLAQQADAEQMPFTTEYGCKVLLCLANPRGPTAESDCRPPIERLWRDLHEGKPFPRCDMAGDSSNNAYAKQGYGWYDPCPNGTSALGNGQYAVTTSIVNGVQQQQIFQGASEGSPQVSLGEGVPVGPTNKVCVGGAIGQTSLLAPGQDYTIQATVYQKIVVMPPASSPRYIDVYVNGQVYQRVRW